MKLEAKIGLFVLMGLSALFILSTQVTKLSGWNQDSYMVHTFIRDATGLELQSSVSMNGVDIGEIIAIAIEGRKVKLTLGIQERVEIPADSLVVIAQESVLGAKAVNIIAGSSAENVPYAGVIEQSKQYAPFDETSDSVNEAAREMQMLMQDMRDVLGEEQKAELKEAIRAFSSVGVNLEKLVLENREALKAAIENMRRMGESFGETADTVNADLPEIMAQLNTLTRRFDTISEAMEFKLPVAVDKFIAIEDNVSHLITENRDSLKRMLVSADTFFDSGQEAFDKVDSMLSNFTVSELQIGLHVDYMMRDSYAKAYAQMAYLPNPETYYLFDLVAMNDYTRTDAGGAVLGPQKHQDTKTLVSGQYGKRFDNLLLRAGVIESTGGAGVDYFADHDRLKISFDAFDFNALNDLRGENAHLKLNVRYRFLKHLELYGGWDNFLNSGAQNLYFGVGMKFIDNNLKYVLGTSTMAL